MRGIFGPQKEEATLGLRKLRDHLLTGGEWDGRGVWQLWESNSIQSFGREKPKTRYFFGNSGRNGG